ncbi:D-sedoheptulose-7-phosphate isomerase [Fictibacillus phosphorivorans]|uniref:D-sedoheptulose-7-phosphate isomerase n=1 Tax=Fictibacillus phosphorivorans TaxID=1221500 RepID=UPI00203BE340|nr:SIS domain-containing protein [Fictibacillus phosphorivorans]MCM3717784.1 SIS domain-containing protein [Fictibacillus phosphorivorans]MCM3777012.1 SIS domain-containing protein [Fictibacillus phosphorivorans]
METVLNELNRKHSELEVCITEVQKAFTLLKNSYRQGGKVLLCGNGGSASDCEHIVGELMKGFFLKRPIDTSFKQKLFEAFPEDGDYLSRHLQGALPAISLVSHSAMITAFANDVAADMIFAQQVFGYGNKEDVLIGLSTSGNSANVVHALQVARAKGMKTIGLTGSKGGVMAPLCDVLIAVPFESTPDIQEHHILIYHALCLMLEKEFFEE